jgi:hypothetical protein
MSHWLKIVTIFAVAAAVFAIVVAVVVSGVR